MDFKPAYCPCGELLLEACFTGLVRVKCRRCRRRVWLAGDGNAVLVALVDPAPRKVTTE